MRSFRPWLPLPLAALLLGCIEDPPLPVLGALPPPALLRPDEGHLSDLEQLTFGGTNGLGRWSWSSKEVILESDVGPQACGRVVRVDPLSKDHGRTKVTSGRDPVFAPGDQEVVYAGGPACPKRPDPTAEHLLDPELEIYRSRLDGSSPRKLTDNPGYDAEAAVCPKDGSILFTSQRDGDLDLYRMDADGGNLRRVTASLGYDGGAVFDATCTRIAWVASRPHGTELAEYRGGLAQHILRVKNTEVWIANADGSDAQQVTYLGAVLASPWWHPTQPRVVFSGNVDASDRREVDLWAVDVNGTSLERITTTPGFDGDPSFSPDGKWLAFASARAEQGRKGADQFAAKWGGEWRHVEERPADHLMGDSAWLAHPAREGRGLGSKGLEDSGAYVERSFKSFGLVPVGTTDFRQAFPVTTQVAGQVTLLVDGAAVAAARVRPLGFSMSRAVSGPLVSIASNDAFESADLTGKIVVIQVANHRAARQSAWLAHEKGAVGLVAVVPAGALAAPSPEGDIGLAAAMIGADVGAPLLARIAKPGKPATGALAVTLAPETVQAFNVVARWPASVNDGEKLPGVVVVGAHYDHVGELSPGADDNASGTAALLQVARSLSENKPSTRRDILLVAFSGEQEGAAGANAFVKHPPTGITAKDILGMVNLDMVGRLRDDTLQVFGEDTAKQWPDLVAGACAVGRVECAKATSAGFGAADHTPFYEAGVPVLHLFTGVHGDYGKPTDTTDKLNASGMAQVAVVAEQLARDLAELSDRLDYVKVSTPLDSDLPEFTVSLGTIPDRAGPPKGQKGMLLAGVRPGGAADKAGLKKGDLVIRLGNHVVDRIEDVMYVLTGAKPGMHMKAIVMRDGKPMTVEMILEEVPKAK